MYSGRKYIIGHFHIINVVLYLGLCHVRSKLRMEVIIDRVRIEEGNVSLDNSTGYP